MNNGAEPKLTRRARLTFLGSIASMWGATLATIVVTGGGLVGNHMWTTYISEQEKVQAELRTISNFIAAEMERDRGRDNGLETLRSDSGRMQSILIDHDRRLIMLEVRRP
jgi:hypothetical protein